MTSIHHQGQLLLLHPRGRGEEQRSVPDCLGSSSLGPFGKGYSQLRPSNGNCWKLQLLLGPIGPTGCKETGPTGPGQGCQLTQMSLQRMGPSTQISEATQCRTNGSPKDLCKVAHPHDSPLPSPGETKAFGFAPNPVTPHVFMCPSRDSNPGQRSPTLQQ